MVRNESPPPQKLTEVNVRVPMNIALIKYWGKRDEYLVLPLNDSISLTVDRLQAQTTVRINDGIGENTVKINGKFVDLGSNRRYERVFNEAIRLQRKRSEDSGRPVVSCHFSVISTTNFPVAAGLASSAAGFAAIAIGLQKLLELDDRQANRLARIGSGSACRSMFGGLVQWRKGEKDDGLDCLAECVDTNVWENLCCMIMVFDDKRKKIGSSEGMRLSAETSTLLKHRISTVVPERIEQIKTAYAARDFKTLAEVIMADSNQFHAICLDTKPPIRYLNEASWRVIMAIESLNKEEMRAAYTFDAGPNACVIMRREDVGEFLRSAIRFNIQLPSNDVNELVHKIGESIVTWICPELQADPELPYIKCTKLILSSTGGSPVF